MPIFEPDEMEIVEALGERLVERAETVLNGEAPNLDQMMMRLDGTLPYSTYLSYELLDGEGLQPWFQSIDAFEERLELRLDGGMTASMNTEQALSEPDADGSSVKFIAHLQLFDRARDAGRYLDESIQRAVENDNYTGVETEEIPGARCAANRERTTIGRGSRSRTICSAMTMRNRWKSRAISSAGHTMG